MKTKNMVFVAQLLIASPLFAGGMSGGTPPAKTDEALEEASAIPALESSMLLKDKNPLSEIVISHSDMSEAIKAALENRKIPVDLGSRIINVRPQSLDFVKKHLQGSVLEDGTSVIIKEVIEAGD